MEERGRGSGSAIRHLDKLCASNLADDDLEARIARQQRHIEAIGAKRLVHGDRSGEDTPPLLGCEDVNLTRGTSLASHDPMLVRAKPPPPPPPPQPPPWVEVENLVMEALRRKDPTLPSGWPALVAAAYEDEVDSVQWLLEAKSNPNEATSNKASPLWHAVANGNARMVGLLLQARADVNHKKKNAKGTWRSVLDLAIHDCVPHSICQELVNAGAKPGFGRPPYCRIADEACHSLSFGCVFAVTDAPCTPLAGGCAFFAHPPSMHSASCKVEPQLALLGGPGSTVPPVQAMHAVKKELAHQAGVHTRIANSQGCQRLIDGGAGASRPRLLRNTQADCGLTESGVADGPSRNRRCDHESRASQSLVCQTASREEVMLALAEVRAEAEISEPEVDHIIYVERKACRPAKVKDVPSPVEVESPGTPPLDDKPHSVPPAQRCIQGADATVNGPVQVQLGAPDARGGRSVRPQNHPNQEIAIYARANDATDNLLPVMQNGSAFAARSAFRKSYSRQLLPLCDEKPVLDFSVYKQKPKQSARSYAGIVLRGPRGVDQEVERARAIITREADKSVPTAAANSLVASSLPDRLQQTGQKQLDTNIAQAYARSKPDLLQDPWGCVLAVAEPDLLPTLSNVLPLQRPIQAPGKEHVIAKRMPAPKKGTLAPVQPKCPPPAVANGGDAAAGGTSSMCRPCQTSAQASPRPPDAASAQIAEVLPTGSLTVGAAASTPSAPANSHVADAHCTVRQSAQPVAAEVPAPVPEASAAFFKSGGLPAIPISKAVANAPPLTLLPRTICASVGKGYPDGHLLGQPCDGSIAGVLQLPRMAEYDVSTGPGAGGSNDDTPTASQWSLVKELAGGARFHDPARDRWASREQVQNTCLVDVRRLRFCHETISPHFMHGEHRGLPVLSLLESLHAGRVDPQKLPPMVVMRSEKGLDVVCGNRRLYCLKRFAAEASKCVSAWCIVYDLKAQDTPRALVMKYILAATTKDGGSIKLRGR